jgi:hypothetical protein
VSQITLRHLLETEFLPKNTRLTCERSRNQYRFAVNNLQELLGREPVLADLTDDNVIRLLNWLRSAKKLHPRTCNDRRGRLNRFWSWLSARGVIATRPTNEPLKEPRRMPDARTKEQLIALMDACRRAAGAIGSLPANVFWTALHLLSWDTAARTHEILYAFRWERIDWQTGWIRIPADGRKGAVKPAAYRLQSDTLEFLATFRQPAGPILGWSMQESRFYQLYKQLLISAGLPHTRYDGLQKMRRTHASWLASAGGDPRRSLLHSNQATTERFYLDPTIAQTGPEPAALLPFRLSTLTEELSQ